MATVSSAVLRGERGLRTIPASPLHADLPLAVPKQVSGMLSVGGWAPRAEKEELQDYGLCLGVRAKQRITNTVLHFTDGKIKAQRG